ncbi:MAG: hypothetical protein ACOYI8_06780 [Christensenellales bacterium]
MDRWTNRHFSRRIRAFSDLGAYPRAWASRTHCLYGIGAKTRMETVYPRG